MKKSGFTLIELIVAMAVTMIATAAALLIFRDSTKANTNVTQASDMSDNLRAGLNLIVQDLIQTGPGIPTGGIPDPQIPQLRRLQYRQARQSASHCLELDLSGAQFRGPGCNVILPAIEPGNGLGPAVISPDGTTGPASDIITIMYADNTLALVQKAINGPSVLAVPSPPTA